MRSCQRRQLVLVGLLAVVLLMAGCGGGGGGQPISHVLSLSGSHGSVRVNGTLHSLPWSGEFSHDATVDLAAVPDNDCEFICWSGDLGASENPTRITMSADKTLTANFLVASCTLDVRAVVPPLLLLVTIPVHFEPTPDQVGEQSPGTTPFVLQYDCGTVITLIAPAQIQLGGGMRDFRRWDIAGLVQPAITVGVIDGSCEVQFATSGEPTSATAVYWLD